MNIIIERKWQQNSIVNAEDLGGMAFQNEIEAHTFRIRGVRANGEQITLAGTVSAIFMRADGTDEEITGTIENGIASVTLTEDCYKAPGRFRLTIFLASGGQKLAIYAATGSVHRTTSGGTLA